MGEKDVTYDAAHIQVLEGLEAIRKRPGMYVGSTGTRGLHALLSEVVERAVAEVLRGRATYVEVTLTADGGARVTDDGEGIPVAAAGHTGGIALEDLLTTVYAGQDRGRRVYLGPFGLGLCVPNALSRRLAVEVRREGALWTQEFERGTAIGPPVAAGPKDRHGTTVAFLPDPEIFEVTEFRYETIADLFRQLASFNDELDLRLIDERPSGDGRYGAPAARAERFRFQGGLSAYLAHLDPEAPSPGGVDPVAVHWEGAVPGVVGPLSVDAAIRWRGVGDGRGVLSFVNSLATREGGVHEQGLREVVAGALTTYARQHGLLPATAPGLDADRIRRAVTAIVSVKLDAPELAGAIRERLAGEPVRQAVADRVRDALGRWLAEDPVRASALLGRLMRPSAAADGQPAVAAPAPGADADPDSRSFSGSGPDSGSGGAA
ncbi:DNA gyrase subunit B [Streptomyces sp. NPDC090025]|uniref:DNA gyrase subunit B n=1 Tax=Streptomyces sp. NPDC090025 TaxID=3365922 RepID=UPI0038381ABA